MNPLSGFGSSLIGFNELRVKNHKEFLRKKGSAKNDQARALGQFALSVKGTGTLRKHMQHPY